MKSKILLLALLVLFVAGCTGNNTHQSFPVIVTDIKAAGTIYQCVVFDELCTIKYDPEYDITLCTKNAMNSGNCTMVYSPSERWIGGRETWNEIGTLDERCERKEGVVYTKYFEGTGYNYFIGCNMCYHDSNTNSDIYISTMSEEQGCEIFVEDGLND